MLCVTCVIPQCPSLRAVFSTHLRRRVAFVPLAATFAERSAWTFCFSRLVAPVSATVICSDDMRFFAPYSRRTFGGGWPFVPLAATFADLETYDDVHDPAHSLARRYDVTFYMGALMDRPALPVTAAVPTGPACV